MDDVVHDKRGRRLFLACVATVTVAEAALATGCAAVLGDLDTVTD